jgi:hypothetical protein
VPAQLLRVSLPGRIAVRKSCLSKIAQFQTIVGSDTQPTGEATYQGYWQKKWPPQKKAATSIQRCAVAYIFIADP